MNREYSPDLERNNEHEHDYDRKNVIFSDILRYCEEQSKSHKSKIDPNKEKRILIVYTGGTIGMVQSDKGYVLKRDYLHHLMKANRSLCDADYTYFNSTDDFLITPESIYKKRIYYKIYEFEDIIDSSNMNHYYWIKIAQFIQANYELYDAFIILHGTDTMAYTAAALSFMFENLKKTIILTGAQIPLTEMKNDAFDNLLGALTISGHFTIPEVSIYFRDKLIRGNRAVKCDSFDLHAFDSPRHPPLAIFSITLQIDWKRIRRVPLDSSDSLKLHTELSDKIAVLKYYPLIPVEVVKSVFDSKVDAIIIETYGVGNLPNNRPEINQVILDTVRRGVIVVIITQCYKGTVSAIYGVGKDLELLGVVSGLDMTLECTIAKLSYLLGKGYRDEKLKTELQRDIRGELTSLEPPKFEIKEETFIKAISDAINMNINNEALRAALFPTIVCYSADFGYITSLQELKAYGANLQAGDYDGKTPLHIAARKGRLEVIKYLISERVNLNPLSKTGRSPLYEAIINQHYEVSKELVKFGAKICAEYEEITNYLLKLVFEGNLKDLRHIYYCGLKNLNDYKNLDGRTIAHIAVSENKYEILKFLKEECSFNFSIKDRWGKTPYDEADFNKNTRIMDLLGFPLTPKNGKGIHIKNIYSRVGNDFDSILGSTLDTISPGSL